MSTFTVAEWIVFRKDFIVSKQYNNFEHIVTT